MKVLIDGVKICRKCGVEKPLSDFHPHKQCKDGVRASCRACVRERLDIWYANTRTERQRVATDNNRKKKLMAIEYKGGVCEDCKQVFHPCVMQFHHLNPSVKDANPSAIIKGSWEKAVVELDKCVLLCANCHLVRHHGGL